MSIVSVIGLVIALEMDVGEILVYDCVNTPVRDCFTRFNQSEVVVEVNGA